MNNEIYYIEILANDFPGFAKQVKRFVKVADYYVFFELEDGKYLRYDDILKTISIYRDYYDMTRYKIKDEMEWRRVFQNKLVRLLTFEGMSQDELADRIDMSVGSVSKYINMQATPSAYVLYKIALVFDRDMNYFFEFL